MVNARALLALLLQAGFLVAAFGWRTMIHRRRTGDSGVRWQRHDRVARVSGTLFVAAIVIGTLGVTLATFEVTALWGPLDGTGAFVTGVGLFAAGAALTLWAQAAMGSSWRIGVDPTERTALVTSGLFGWVRNPIFTAMVTAAVGLAVLAPTALTAASVALLIIAVQLQVRRIEEPHLSHAMPGWLDYARHVGRFLPRLGRIET